LTTSWKFSPNFWNHKIEQHCIKWFLTANLGKNDLKMKEIANFKIIIIIFSYCVFESWLLNSLSIGKKIQIVELSLFTYHAIGCRYWQCPHTMLEPR
jgi:hypothetical protein